MDRPRPDDVSAMLESACNLGRSSRYGLRRRRIFGAAAAQNLASPLKSVRAADAARRARRLRLAGRDDEAAAGFARAVALDPDCAEAVAFQWEALWTPKASSSGINRAIALEPEEPLWKVWRGLAELAGRVEGRRPDGSAKRFFDEALALRESPLAWAGLALAELEAGRAAAAVAACGRAIALEPAQGWLYRLRAKARLKVGDEPGFLDDCRRETLLDEGVGTLCEVFPPDRRRPVSRLLAAAERFLARRPKAHWMLVVRGDCRRSPEINDFAGAVDDFRAAAALAPDCAYTHAYLCRALMVAGRAEEAMKAVDRAIALAPASGWIRVWRGELRRRLGDNAGALKDFDEGLSLDPDYEMGYAWRGGARRALGRPREAVADLNLAAALDPGYAWSFAERSLAQRALGRFGPALRDLEAAARLDSKYVWCARPQEFPGAVAQLDAAVKAAPRDAWAWAWRGETRLRLGDAPGAVSDLRRATKLGPKLGWPRAWLGQALALSGRTAEAMRAFDAAVALDPSYPPALAERGRLLLSRGETRAAWKDLSRAAAAGPLSARTWQSKGEAGLGLRLWARAVEDFSKALELERGWRPRVGRAAAYEKLGRRAEARADLAVPLEEARRLAAEGRHAESVAVCSEALVLHPRFAPFLAARATARRRAGDFAGALADARAAVRASPREAWSELDAAVAAEPGCAWALALRGETRRASGHLKEGLADVLAAVRVEGACGCASGAPSTVWAYARRGAIARREERWADARADLERALRLDPTCVWARAWAGELCLARGENGRARALLSAAVKRAPRWADAQCWFGRALCAEGKCGRAQAAFSAALKADPKHVWAWISTGHCHERRGRSEPARRAYARARALAPALFPKPG